MGQQTRKRRPLQPTIGAVVAVGIATLFAPGAVLGQGPGNERPPNFVIVYTDDQGYADVGCFGAKAYATPNLDRMAAEGVRLTDFYVAQAVCSASRTALLTGCYPNRVGILGALGPASETGINADETTIAEVLKARGYATAIFGKWHLGHHPRFLPTHHGFDAYFGLPYSNDMWPKHPTNRSFPDLPLIDGERIAGLNPDQRMLTTWYTEHALRFLDEHKDGPFFLYVPHSMPHVPIFVSEERAGRSGAGLYGDVIGEIDWSVGRILAKLEALGLDERTLVVFASDNGPWLSYGDHAGSAEPLREGKGTTFEGGVRVPFIARWPGRIPAGSTCEEPAMTIDLLPTFAHLAGADLPDDRIRDGLDIMPLLEGQADARSPHEALYFYWGRELQALRSGKWKLHLPHEYRSLKGEPGSGGRPGPYVERSIGLSLFDLEADIGEARDVAAENPEVVRRLQSLVERARLDLGDSATGQDGANVRPPGRL